MFVRRQSAGLEVWTPAKVNLTLEVLARRSDGFHDVETCIATIGLFDTLLFQPDKTGQIRLVVDLVAGYPPDVVIPVGADNLIVRSLQQLQVETGCQLGARVQLTKRIPAAAGLGGGSSDAAAALYVANLSWGLGLSRDELARSAAMIGSDVASFLFPSPTICRGRGEEVEVVARGVGRLELVIVRPPEGLSTGEVYGRTSLSEDSGAAKFMTSLGNVPGRHDVHRMMNNGLQTAAEGLSPWVSRLAKVFEGMGFVGHQMSGSGTAYFGVCQHAKHANGLANRLRALQVGHVYRTSSYRGAISA